MKNYFEDYDTYCFCVNNNSFLTAEDMAHMEDSAICYEIDSDYAYEKRMDRLADEWS